MELLKGIELDNIRYVLKEGLGRYIDTLMFNVNVGKVDGKYMFMIHCLPKEFDILVKYFRNVYGVEYGYKKVTEKSEVYISRLFSKDELKRLFDDVEVLNLELAIERDLKHLLEVEFGFRKIALNVEIYRDINGKYILGFYFQCFSTCRNFVKDMNNVWDLVKKRYNIDRYEVIKNKYGRHYIVEYDNIDSLGAIVVACKLYL